MVLGRLERELQLAARSSRPYALMQPLFGSCEAG